MRCLRFRELTICKVTEEDQRKEKGQPAFHKQIILESSLVLLSRELKFMFSKTLFHYKIMPEKHLYSSIE